MNDLSRQEGAPLPYLGTEFAADATRTGRAEFLLPAQWLANRRAEPQPAAPCKERFVVGYARYSSATQNDHSIDRQVRDINAYREVGPRGVDAMFVDRAVTGKKAGRSGLDAMFKYLAEHKGGIVVVASSDRLAREIEVWVNIWGEIRRCGSVLHDARKGPIETGMDVLFSAAVPAIDYDRITAMMAAGRRAWAAAGHVQSVAIGYAKVPGERGVRVIDEEGASIVRDIFDGFDKGLTVYDLVKMARANYPTVNGRRKRWSSSSIEYILSNLLYVGVHAFGKRQLSPTEDAPCRKVPNTAANMIVRAVPHLRIVDPDVFGRAQERLGRPVEGPGSGSRRTKYALKGKVRCTGCGSALGGGRGHDGIVWVRCHNAFYGDGTCEMRSAFRLDRVEIATLTALKGLLADPAFDELYLDGKKDARLKRDRANATELQGVRARVAKLNDVLEKSFERDMTAGYSDEFLTRQRRKAHDEIEDLQRHALVLESRMVASEPPPAIGTLRDRLSDLLERSPFIACNAEEAHYVAALRDVVRAVRPSKVGGGGVYRVETDFAPEGLAGEATVTVVGRVRPPRRRRRPETDAADRALLEGTHSISAEEWAAIVSRAPALELIGKRRKDAPRRLVEGLIIVSEIGVTFHGYNRRLAANGIGHLDRFADFASINLAEIANAVNSCELRGGGKIEPDRVRGLLRQARSARDE